MENKIEIITSRSNIENAQIFHECHLPIHIFYDCLPAPGLSCSVLNATCFICIFVSTYFYFVSFLFENKIFNSTNDQKSEKKTSSMHDQSDSRSLSDSLDNIPSNVFGPDGLVTRFTLPLSYGRKEARQKRVG